MRRVAQPATLGWAPNQLPAYRSSAKRAPQAAAIALPSHLMPSQGPRWGPDKLRAGAGDLTTQVPGGTAQGQRILVHGRVSDAAGRPEAHALIEIWQANAAGRYWHPADQHAAPLDPYFLGAGQVLTDAQGCYEFLSIEPGAYPWGNHPNGWRPKHIHLSLFGAGFAARLVTQLYFPGDPLLPLDPIFMSIPQAANRARLVAQFDLLHSRPEWALAYRFDVVLRGHAATPLDPH